MKSTFCFIYNELVTHMQRSKRRKDYWKTQISRHVSTCDSCKERVKNPLTLKQMRGYNRNTK